MCKTDMSSELLEREEQYRKLNAELEMRTKELLNEVNSAMTVRETFKTTHVQNVMPCSKLRNALPSEQSASVKTPTLSSKSKPLLPEEKAKWDQILPPESENMGTKGLTHFLKAKLRTTQSELDKMKTDYKIKCEEFKTLKATNEKLEEERTKLQQLANSSTAISNKMEGQVVALTSRLQTRENEIAALKKEIDGLKRDLKNATINTSGNEIRLNRALEEVEKLRNGLKVAKQEEKESKDLHRKQTNEMSVTIKRLEKHKSDLLNAFKKQLLLIDNLKKQKAHLEAAKLMHITGDEFTKILDWKPHGI